MDDKKLIKLVRLYPEIYDTYAESSANQHLKNMAWNRIANEMGVTAIACKDKWSILRGSCKRYLRQKAENKNKRKWHLADEMSFMEECLVIRTKKSRVSSDTASTEDLDSSNVEMKIEIGPETSESPQEHFLNDQDSNNAEIKIETDPENIQSPTTPPPISSEVCREISLASNISDNVSDQQQPIDDFIKLQKSRVSLPVVVANEPDYNSCSASHMFFFNSLIPDMERLSTRRQRKFKEQVMSLLNKFLDEEDDEIATSGS